MRSLALLVVVRVHTWSDVCPVCGSMRNTGSLYVLHAPRLPKSSLLAALVVYTHTICVRVHVYARVLYMCVFIYIWECVCMCMSCIHLKEPNRTSRENAILCVRVVCLADRGVLGVVEKLWNLVAYGSRVLSLAED